MKQNRLLIVEDEIIIAEDLQRRLERLGYEVVGIASSGEEAINIVKEKTPDLILMDIIIQGKMDGIETANNIKYMFDIPIIYLTAFSDEETLKRAKITEPFGYMVKPYRERELSITIEIALYKYNVDKKVKELNRWLSSIINGIGDAVIATDTEGTIRLLNPMAEAMTGWKQEEALGKSLSSVFNVISRNNEKIVENPVSKALREGEFFGLVEQSVLISKSGTQIPVDIIGSSIVDEKNKTIGIVIIFYDILRTGNPLPRENRALL